MSQAEGYAYGPSTSWGTDFLAIPAKVLAQRARRFDAETYLGGGYGIRLELEAGMPSAPLSEVADELWQPNRLKGISVDPSVGRPFLAAGQVFDIRPTPRKYLAPRYIPSLEARVAEPGLLLLTRSGTVGRCIVAYAAHAGAVLTDDLIRIRIRDSLERGYVYAFLRSRYGRTMLEAPQYGSIVKHLETHHIAELPIPRISEVLGRQVSGLIDRAYELRDTAYALHMSAERAYEGHFPTVPGSSSDSANVASASNLMSGRRRLDGQFHSMLAATVIQSLQESGRLERLGDRVEDLFGVPRFKHVYQERGVPYLDSEDLFVLLPEVTKFIPEVTHKSAAQYFVKRGWLLMACSGQTYGLNGRCVIATSSHEDKIISNHVVRIVPRDIPVGYLAVALGHPRLGRPLVTRLAFGSEVPEISPADLADCPLPRLQADEERRIAQMMEDSSTARGRADGYEAEAIALVEHAVEDQLGKGESGDSSSSATDVLLDA